jgi:hypothetical protein
VESIRSVVCIYIMSHVQQGLGENCENYETVRLGPLLEAWRDPCLSWSKSTCRRNPFAVWRCGAWHSSLRRPRICATPMSGHTQRSQSTGNPTKSKASHKAKRKETAPGKQTPTQKKAPNDTDTGSYDEGGAVTTSVETPCIPKSIDAVSSDRPSSLFRLASPTGEVWHAS